MRYNENRRYEIKFGNGLTGKKLVKGEEVAIYYLKSDGAAGTIGTGALGSAVSVKYNTVQFRDIFNDILDSDIQYVEQSDLNSVKFLNDSASSDFYIGESVDDIRSRAPKVFSSSHRLVTKDDYESYISQKFSNFVQDVQVVSNEEYLKGHLAYIVDTLELTQTTSRDARTVLNAVNFADACDFNNVYIYSVPKLARADSTVIRANYLTVAQKNTIMDSIRDKKTITSEPVLMDPVYVAASPGLFNSSVETLTVSVIDNTVIRVTRSPNSVRSMSSIENAINNIFNNYFNAIKLGDTLSISEISSEISNLEGVQELKTIRTDTGQEADGVNLLLWNPVYESQDIAVISSNVNLPYFKYPYLYDSTNFLNKIQVVQG